MNVKKIGCLVAVLAPLALFGLTPAQAKGEADSVAMAKAPAPMPAVIVKVGDALLEEYRGGDSAKRTTILRGEVAQNAGSAVSRKKHS